MTTLISQRRSHSRHSDFSAALRAEWTKFRTVRGWVAGVALMAGLLVLFAYLTANGMHSGTCTTGPGGAAACGAGHPRVPIGPGGEAVADSYYLVSKQLTGDGTLTARVDGLSGVTSSGPANAAPSPGRTRPGIPAWSKAGIIVTASTRQGAAFAAVMASHGRGVRFQYDYTHDSAGMPGSVSASSPRWLRLRRSGQTLTASDSSDDRHWQRIGSATLQGLGARARIGLFVTSPVTFGGLASMGTGVFDHVALSGEAGTGSWRGQAIGEGQTSFYSTLGQGSYHRAGGSFTIHGSGDISPAITADGDTAANILLQPLVVALLVAVIVATLFITGEYRRGLIRTTLAAIPNRTEALIAKAVVVGAVAFLAGAAATAIAIPLGNHLLTTNGNYLWPSHAATQARMIVGTGALLGLAAIGVLATGAIVRTSAGTVITGIVLFVMPVVLAVPFIQGGSANTPAYLEWLERISPGAGLAVLGAMPRSAAVSYPYTLGNGYFPLSPGAGLAVLAAWALVLLLLAVLLLCRRDA
jgi:ABC-type transport system involved in multi-copper enzyme maturation permease subunit